MTVTRDSVAGGALDWLGVPFFHQGRSRQGVDCIGLIYLLGLELNADLRGYVDDPTYGRDPDSRLHLRIDNHLDRLVPQPVRPPAGTILLFRYGRLGQHLGIVQPGGESFIHAYEPERRVVITRIDQRWKNRLLGVFDYAGVTG